MKLQQTLAASLIAIAAIVTAQCGGGDAKSSSGLLSLPSSASSVASDSAVSARAVGDTEPLGTVVAELGKIKVCKDGDGSANFVITQVDNAGPGATGTVTSQAAANIPAGSCVTVAQDSVPASQSPATAGANITVEESLPEAANLASVMVITNSAGTITGPTAAANPVTRNVNNFHGRVIIFTNDVPDEPPPPTGSEGCTPGYWKQSQHFDSWVGYAQGDDFDATFGVDFFNPNITLLQAAGLGGGGTAALARHAVAALLNVSNPDVDYTYTLAQVLDIVQGDGDYSGLSVEARKNLLVTANELGCPIS